MDWSGWVTSMPDVERCQDYLSFYLYSTGRARGPWACGKCPVSVCQVMLPNRMIVLDTFPLRAFKAKYLSLAKVNNRPDVSLDGTVVTSTRSSLFYFLTRMQAAANCRPHLFSICDLTDIRATLVNYLRVCHLLKEHFSRAVP